MNPPDRFAPDVSRLQLGLYGGVALLVTVFALPTVQSILYSTLVGTPSVLQWGAVSVVIAALGAKRESRVLLAVAVGVFVVLGLVVGPVVSGAYAHSDVADRMQRQTTDLETLPNTSTENVRVLPRSVSDNYAQSSMQYPQYRLTGSDITYRNGSYAWSYGLAPDNLMVALTGQQKGALYVNMTTARKQVHVQETTFSNGRGQLFFDSYKYQSVLHSPFKQHNWDTTFNARANGTSYIAHS